MGETDHRPVSAVVAAGCTRTSKPIGAVGAGFLENDPFIEQFFPVSSPCSPSGMPRD